MNPVLSRFITIVIGLNFACLGALVVICVKLILLVALNDPGESLGYVLSVFFVLALLGAAFPPLITLAPVLIAIFVAEYVALRSWVYYVGAGALTALVAGVATDQIQASDIHSKRHAIDTGLFLLAGITGGLIYWWLAGRTTGAEPAGKEKQ